MPSDHEFVYRVAGDDVVDINRPFMPGLKLPHRADAADDLIALVHIPPMPKERNAVAMVLQPIDAVPHACGVAEADLVPAGLELAHLHGVRQHTRGGERLQQPGEVRLEVVSHQHRRTVGLLDDRLERLDLHVVDFFPFLRPLLFFALDEGIDIHRAVAQLETLLRSCGRVERLGFAVLHHREHFLFHLAVFGAGLGRQINEAGHMHGRVKIEVIGRVNTQTHVRQCGLDLLACELQRRGTEAVGAALEPALSKSRVGAAKSFTCIDEPRLAVQVLEAVRCWRAGQLNHALDFRVCNLRKCRRAYPALLQTEGLQLAGLVDHDGTERPTLAVLFHQPGQILEVDGVDGGVIAQRGAAFGFGTDDGHNVDVPHGLPLPRLVGPRVPRHDQRRNHQRGHGLTCKHERIECEEGSRGLARAHVRPYRAARQVDNVVYHALLIRTGHEVAEGVHLGPALDLAASGCSRSIKSSSGNPQSSQYGAPSRGSFTSLPPHCGHGPCPLINTSHL